MIMKTNMENIMRNQLKDVPSWSQDTFVLLSTARESQDECSVPQLIDQLCLKLCEDLNEHSNIQKRKYVKRFRSLAFQILLKKSSCNFDMEYNIVHKDELIATLVDQIFSNEMRVSTWTKKKSQQLRKLADRLSDGMNDLPYLGSVITFLLSMSEPVSVVSSKTNLSGLDVNHQLGRLQSMHSFPGINVSSSDTIGKSYSDYTPSLFDTKMIVDSPFVSYCCSNKMTDIRDFPVDSEPGSGLKLFEKFSTLWSSNNKNCGSTRDFSANQKMKSLSIPELNLDVPRSLTIPSLRSSHLDEGYVTPDKEFLDENDKDSISKKSSPDVWHHLTTDSLTKPLRYTWESLGKAELTKEPPFLLEADLDVVECWKKHSRLLSNYDTHSTLDGGDIRSSTSHKLDGEGVSGELNTISFKEFFRDVKCLLIAVNSKTFYFDEVLNSFVIKPGICVPGVTPEGLEVYSKDLIDCGNNFRSLDLLIKNNCMNMRPAIHNIIMTDCTLPSSAGSISNSPTTSTAEALKTSETTVHNGLVFEAMCTSISCWLQAYRGVVIKMVEPDSSSLLDVKLWLHPLQQQLQFLANLCGLSLPDFKLPTGGALLTHIYNVVQVTVSKPFSYILYLILENCAKVYFRFLENWLFEGICDDLYEEFFIEQRSCYETAKDRSYWRRTFFIKPERVPVFLSSLVNDIFVCGKTLNLVKFCNPSDPLCERLEKVYPRMTPCFEEDSLDKLVVEYHEYVLSCENACAEVPLPKVFYSPEFETDEERESRFEAVSQQRTKSLDKIKKAQEEELKEKDNKKRKLFEVMKNEMLEAEKRKKEEREKVLQEDQKRLEELAQAALIDATRKSEEKQRIFQYYKSLSDAADNRKLRAEWKIKRLRLNNKRMDFLAEDKQRVKEELMKVKRDQHYHPVIINNDECNEGVKALAVPVVKSASSSSSWLTCPSYSIESCSARTSKAVTSKGDVGESELDDVIKSDDTADNGYDSLRSGSFNNLLNVENKENTELKHKKSSSDTDIYVSSLYNGNVISDNFNNNSNINRTNNVNNLNTKTAKVDGIKSSVISSILTKSDDNKEIPKITNAFEMENNNVNNKPGIINSEHISNTPLSKGADFNKNESIEHIMSPKTTNISCDMGSETELRKIDFADNYEDNEKRVELNKLFCDARNAALLNKQKVYKDEYGIVDVNSKMNEKLTDYSSCKDKVLEMKNKMNETAIKERTEELALACSNFVESRKAAARNKARVMSSEYSIFADGSVKTVKEKINKTVIVQSVDESTDKVGDKSSVSDGINYEQSIPSEESEIEVCKETEKSSFILSSDCVDSSGQFMFDKKPLILDIADKILSQKSDSLLSTHENADYTTIHYCLYKSVEIPTEIQKIFTNDAVLRLFIINEKLLDHLQCIRNYFFLLDGEYGRTLTQLLFTDLENVEQPSALLTYLRLNTILRSAVRSLQNESPLMERLSFFVKDVPLVFVLTDPEVLNCLSMRYRVHWPLNVIVTDDAIINYDRIFAFQLKIQRAAWALEQDMQLLKMKNMMRSSHYRQLQIFRHTMTQFVRAVSNYITRIALEESWIEFKNNLSKADTLDALHSAHVCYIKMVLFRCLLNKRSETIQKSIVELLRNILTYHELLRTGEWVYDLETGDHTHSAFTRLSHHYSAFVRTLRSLIKFLNQVIGRGYQPHLEVLITFLSGNDFYLREV